MHPKEFEELIEAALRKAPTDADLAETYTDAADRQRVRRRALIAATLSAVVMQSQQRFQRNADGSVDVEPNAGVFSELASAMRDFDHDRARADLGKSAELILRPVGRGSIDELKTVTAARKNLIRWLAVIDLWDGNRDPDFISQTELFKFAAKKGAGKAGSLRTELSNFRRGEASAPELSLFYDMIDLAKSISRADAAKSPFELLLPAALALGETSAKRTIG
jgi:hypothetical protein